MWHVALLHSNARLCHIEYNPVTTNSITRWITCELVALKTYYAHVLCVVLRYNI